MGRRQVTGRLQNPTEMPARGGMRGRGRGPWLLTRELVGDNLFLQHLSRFQLVGFITEHAVTVVLGCHSSVMRESAAERQQP